MWGDGSARRDFMYVNDMAKAIVEIMEKLQGPVNGGSGNVLSIRQVVEGIAEIADMKDRVVWDATKPNGQDYRAYDLSKLNSIGFTCDYSLERGLKETWDWYGATAE